MRFKRPCRKPGCGKLATGTYCDAHSNTVKEQRQRYDDERGTATQRGYTSEWSRYSKRYRKEHPLCVECLKAGKLTSVEYGGHVDHIKAVTGPDDPLFWVESNHQSLCHSCHSRKTTREDGGGWHGKSL